jgi:hypothetical protein
MGTMRTREKADGEKPCAGIFRVKNQQIIADNETQTYPRHWLMPGSCVAKPSCC